MKLPQSKLGLFTFMFSVELSAFFISGAGGRATALGNYTWSAFFTTFLVIQNFAIIKIMAEDPRGRSWLAASGCAIGATLGVVGSIWVTKHLLGA
jgi:hypothetical protein